MQHDLEVGPVSLPSRMERFEAEKRLRAVVSVESPPNAMFRFAIDSRDE
jgi:hypothetical protein